MLSWRKIAINSFYIKFCRNEQHQLFRADAEPVQCEARLHFRQASKIHPERKQKVIIFYNFKLNKKFRWIRLLTVLGYVVCVSLPAIALSIYYIYIWDPDYISKVEYLNLKFKDNMKKVVTL